MTEQLDTPATTARPSARRIVDVSWGLARTSALVTALDLDVFSHIADGRRTSAAIAEAAGADERATASLLLALAGLGLLEPADDGGYELAPDADAYLVRGRRGYLGDLRHVHRQLNFPLWPQLTDSVKRGSPPEDAFAIEDSNVWDSVLPYINALGAPAARWIATLVSAEVRPAPRVLDVGCGSGLYGQAIAKLDPSAAVRGLDRRAVVRFAAERARDEGLAIDYVEGDLRTTDWSEDYDVVVMSHLLHGYDPEACRELVARAARALAPGGLLVIHEFIPDPKAPERTPMPALFGLEMLLTSSGAAYSADDYRGWLEASGLVDVRQQAAPAGPTSVILATSPPAEG